MRISIQYVLILVIDLEQFVLGTKRVRTAFALIVLFFGE